MRPGLDGPPSWKPVTSARRSSYQAAIAQYLPDARHVFDRSLTGAWGFGYGEGR